MNVKPNLSTCSLSYFLGVQSKCAATVICVRKKSLRSGIVVELIYWIYIVAYKTLLACTNKQYKKKEAFPLNTRLLQVNNYTSDFPVSNLYFFAVTGKVKIGLTIDECLIHFMLQVEVL